MLNELPALLKHLQNVKAWDVKPSNQGTSGKPKSFYDDHITDWDCTKEKEIQTFQGSLTPQNAKHHIIH